MTRQSKGHLHARPGYGNIETLDDEILYAERFARTEKEKTRKSQRQVKMPAFSFNSCAHCHCTRSICCFCGELK